MCVHLQTCSLCQWDLEDLAKSFDRARPQTLLVERDSDASKNVGSSRCGAFGKLSCLNLRTGVCLKGSETDVDLRLEVIHKHYICWRRMGIDVLSTVPADMIYEIICAFIIYLVPGGTDLDYVRSILTFKER